MKCFALLIVAGMLVAQNPDAARPLAKCVIEGQVLNAVTGEPLKKAQLTLNKLEGRNFSSYGAATDAGGWFAFEGIEPGRYRLMVERNGYVARWYGAGRSGAILALDSGQRLRDVVIRLTPHAVISGRVLDDDGEPISEAWVCAMRYRYLRGKRQLVSGMTATTNDLGEYRLPGLRAGRVYICAVYPEGTRWGFIDRTLGRSSRETALEDGYAPTYYPGSGDPAGAVALEVAAGAQLRGIDLTLLKTRTVRLRGRVSNFASGRSGKEKRQNANVDLQPRDPSLQEFLRHISPINSQGNFEIAGVAPGSYVLSTIYYDGSRNYSARQPIEVGEDNIDSINLVLTAGPEVAGQIRVEGQAEAKLAGVDVQVRSRDSATGHAVGARVQDGGKFSLQGLDRDQYIVSVSGAPDGFYVQSIRMGAVDVLESGLDLTRGGAGPIEIVLSPNGGQIEGVVLNAQQKPSDGATVVLVPESGRREQPQLYKNVSTDQYGRFNIKGIAPGDYKLFAWEDVEAGAWQDPDFLKPVEDRGESYSIRANSRESAQLKLIPAADTQRESLGMEK